MRESKTSHATLTGNPVKALAMTRFTPNLRMICAAIAASLIVGFGSFSTSCQAVPAFQYDFRTGTERGQLSENPSQTDLSDRIGSPGTIASLAEEAISRRNSSGPGFEAMSSAAQSAAFDANISIDAPPGQLAKLSVPEPSTTIAGIAALCLMLAVFARNWLHKRIASARR
jgi:hypothetical protein